MKIKFTFVYLSLGLILIIASSLSAQEFPAAYYGKVINFDNDNSLLISIHTTNEAIWGKTAGGTHSANGLGKGFYYINNLRVISNNTILNDGLASEGENIYFRLTDTENPDLQSHLCSASTNVIAGDCKRIDIELLKCDDNILSPTPVIFQADSIGSHYYINWEKIDNPNIIGYYLFRSMEDQLHYQQISTLLTSNYFDDIVPNPIHTYYYTIRAISSVSDSTFDIDWRESLPSSSFSTDDAYKMDLSFIEMSIEPKNPAEGDSVQLAIKIKCDISFTALEKSNLKNNNFIINPFTVRVWDGEPNTSNLIYSMQINDLEFEEEYIINIDIIDIISGEHNFYISLDTKDEIGECNENNLFIQSLEVSELVIVELSHYELKWNDSGAILHWETDYENSLVGFNIWRASSVDGEIPALENYKKINYKLIKGHSPYLFLDRNIQNGITYYYFLEDIDTRGFNKYHPALCLDVNNLPQQYSLEQNVPNPFNPMTKIVYALLEDTMVQLNIYNAKGQLINELVDERKKAGCYAILWDGKDGNGKDVASGVYIYILKTDTYYQEKSMILLK